ncbi:MAG TPA: hypothetical protein VF765_24645 [Polyangiaceae bacterium]
MSHAGTRADPRVAIAVVNREQQSVKVSIRASAPARICGRASSEYAWPGGYSHGDAERFLRLLLGLRLPSTARALVVPVFFMQTGSACDCPPTVTKVEDGQHVGSVVPSDVVAPRLGDHRGQLTWVFSGRTTGLHFDVERSSDPITSSTTDCGMLSDETPEFSANLVVRVTTDDGVFDAGSTATLEFGPDGHLPDPSFIVNADLDAAQAAGTGTGVIGGLCLDFTVETQDGQPQATTIGIPLGGDGLTTIARITF